jgi:hypothetical protein
MTTLGEQGPIESTVMWRTRNLTVLVSVDADGVLHFSGNDFGGFADSAEYEYEMQVQPADIVRIFAALEPQPGDNVVTLLCRNAETIIKTGEQNWLRSLGIEPGFWSHFS